LAYLKVKIANNWNCCSSVGTTGSLKAYQRASQFACCWFGWWSSVNDMSSFMASLIVLCIIVWNSISCCDIEESVSSGLWIRNADG